MIERHLAEAERHVAEGQDRIEQQRRIIAELERDEHETAQARKLLATFEATQALYVAERDRLERELAAARD